MTQVKKLSLEHVHRSRTEPGCISHAVHVDCENPLRLVFFEQWADRAALLTHFAVPASREFVKALQSLAVGRDHDRNLRRDESREAVMHGCFAMLVSYCNAT